MGGGGKKGGGGGSAAGGTFNSPTGLYQGAAAETGLGQYSTALLNPLAAMTSWASSLATGGSVNVPSPQAFATQAGPTALAHGQGKPWDTSFDPSTGLITFTNPTDPAQTFQSDLQGAQKNFDLPSSVIQQWQNASNAYQQYQTSQTGAGGVGSTGTGTAGGSTYLPATASYLPAAESIPAFQQWFGQNQGQTVFVGGQARTIGTDLNADQALAAYQSGQLGWNSPAGPLLSQAYQDIQAQQAATQQMPGIEAQTQALINQTGAESAKYQTQGDTQYGQAQQFYTMGSTQEQQAQQLFGVGYNELSAADQAIVDANALVQMTTTGQGLFPAQQAMIDQARQSEETQLASTLGGAGLGKSTQLAQMTGAADQAAAATAGQLQQGNIQAAEQVMTGALGQHTAALTTLGQATTQEQVAAQSYGLGQAQQQLAQQSYELSQAAEKISLGGQTLLTNEQNQLVVQLANITSQSAGFQQQMWAQAMQGYGLMGNIIQNAGQSYGYSLSAYTNVLQEMEKQNEINAGIQEAAMTADQQGTSSLFGGLGQLLGGSQGLSGMGGLGGLLGGAGAGTGLSFGGAAAGSLAGDMALAGVGGTAAAGGGGVLAGIGGALTALFCEVAQEVYGFDNPRWERFRKWLLFRGPRWFLRFYGRNARYIAAWLSGRPRIKWVLGILMDAVAR